MNVIVKNWVIRTRFRDNRNALNKNYVNAFFCGNKLTSRYILIYNSFDHYYTLIKHFTLCTNYEKKHAAISKNFSI